MQADLLYIYVKNHYNGLLPYAAALGFFLLMELQLYGVPDQTMVWFSAILLSVSAIFVMRQVAHYKKILAVKGATVENWQAATVTIVINKLGYIIPWLVMIFWPLEAQYTYNHLIGYLYVFCAVAIYVSASSVFFPLFIFELTLHVLFMAYISWLNFDLDGTDYVVTFMAIFFLYTLIAGRKISASTRMILENRMKLEKAILKAEKASRAKSEFLGVISHEIRTPMVGIMGMIDILNESEMNLSQRQALAVVTDCSKSLLNTINDLLDTSAMEAGTFAINLAEFNCYKLLSNMAETMDVVAKAKGISFVLDVAEDFPDVMVGDSNRIYQVLSNLTNNAIKFTEEGTVTLSAQLMEDGRTIRFEVVDTGIGISKKNQSKLFKRFSQVDSTISRKFGGTGLGLSIAKSLVDIMDGKLGVISAPDKGSTFWVELPYQTQSAEKNLVEDVDRVREGLTFKVLLVEDNQINSMITARLLQKKGHIVTVVEDGKAAVAIARDMKFDVILMDINIPGMDGIAATIAIRALGEEWRSIPIIGLSANSIPAQIEACKKAGMVETILKPYVPKEFYKVISEHVYRKFDRDIECMHEVSVQSKLRSIEEELGPDYMKYLLKTSAAELDRLNGLIREAFTAGDFLRVTQLAHELKGVGGSIGLTAIYNTAEKLEYMPVTAMAEEGLPFLNELDIRIQSAHISLITI